MQPIGGKQVILDVPGRQGAVLLQLEYEMITSQTWRQRFSEDMQLRDLRPKTRESYELAVQQFLQWAKVEPAALTENTVREYVLHLRNDKKLSASSVNVAVYALRFFITQSLEQDWRVFELLRVSLPARLPTVLTLKEARSVLRAVRHPVRQMALTTIYGLGLRLNEGLTLKASQIDSSRRMVLIRNGKRARDRAVPLPQPLLMRLRQYWSEDRPRSATEYLFVAEHGQGPFHETVLQRTLASARKDAKLLKPATVHTLRHSYATYLLEHGVSLRAIQQILGHKSMRSTEIYLHVTQAGMVRVQEVVDRLVAGL